MPLRRSNDVTFTEIEEGGEVVLFVPAEQRAVVVNATAAIVWLLCNGQRDAEELAAELTTATGTEVRCEEVLAVLRELTSQGVLSE